MGEPNRLVEWIGLLGAMGPLLFLCSIVALAILGERLWFLATHRLNRRGVERRLRAHSDQLAAGLPSAILRDMRSPLAQIASDYLTTSGGIAERRRAAELRFAGWLSRARAPIRHLSMVAQIAPLLGLTGTVLGLVAAFRVIEASERMVSPSLLAGGIWEALLTTIVGMLISIPLIVAVRLFQHYLEHVVREAREFLLWLEHMEHRPQAERSQPAGDSLGRTQEGLA